VAGLAGEDEEPGPDEKLKRNLAAEEIRKSPGKDAFPRLKMTGGDGGDLLSSWNTIYR
jgi:hypothetical protein